MGHVQRSSRDVQHASGGWFSGPAMGTTASRADACLVGIRPHCRSAEGTVELTGTVPATPGRCQGTPASGWDLLTTADASDQTLQGI